MADKTVRLVANISGTRNGEDWPAAGQEVTLPDDEADLLIRNGQAVDPGQEEENALADVLGVSTATLTDARSSVRAQLKPAPHADEPQAYHIPVLAGEEAAASEGQEAVDQANVDLGVPVEENKAVAADESPADAPADPAPSEDAAPAPKRSTRKAADK